MVLLLLSIARMLGRRLSAVLCAALLLGLTLPDAGVAAERTFLLSPDEIVGASDDFNAQLLARSARFGKALRVRSSGITLAGKSCPSLTVDPSRMVTRFRVLDGPARAGLLAGRGGPVVADALTVMGATPWAAPADGATVQPFWVEEPPADGVLGFVTGGFDLGQTGGAFSRYSVGDTGKTFRLQTEMASSPGVEASRFVLMLTSELPPTRPGRHGKRTDCFLVAPVVAADLQALEDLVTAASLSDATRTRLQNILDDANARLAHGELARAASAVKRFGVEVTSRSAAEIGPEDAEAMTTRATLVIEALGL